MDETTINIYNQKTNDYAQTIKKAGPDATLLAFIARVPSGGLVLDLGCGLGNASAEMVKAGLRVDPLDASQGMVDYAKREYNLPARLGDFSELKGPYDAVWANFSLLHMARADIRDYLPRLSAHLKTGGILHLGMKIGSGEKRDSLGRRYSYLTADEADAWLTRAGFCTETPVFGETMGLDNVLAPFFTLTAVKEPKDDL